MTRKAVHERQFANLATTMTVMAPEVDANAYQDEQRDSSTNFCFDAYALPVLLCLYGLF